jgi:hypothetical protein
MFRVETRGGASVVWRQAETSVDEPTGSYAPRGKWSAGGRGFRSRAYAHVSEGAASGTNSLTATGITTGQPTLGSPALGAGSGTVDLVALGFITGVPSLGSPAMGQINVLGATGITTGVPTVGSATNTTESSVLGSRVGTKTSDYPVRRRYSSSIRR